MDGEKIRSVNVLFLCLFALFQVILYSAASLSKTVFTLGNYLFMLVFGIL